MSSTHSSVGFLMRANPLASLCEEIARAAKSVLQHSHNAELRALTCDYSAGILRLRGTVGSEAVRRSAEQAVAHVPGVLEVKNCVEVGRCRIASHAASTVNEPPALVGNPSVN